MGITRTWGIPSSCPEAPATPRRSPARSAAARLQQIKECVEFTQSTVYSFTQQRKQRDSRQAPRSGTGIPSGRQGLVGYAERPPPQRARKRKFTRLYKQFKVIAVIGNNAYRLDTLKGIYNIFQHQFNASCGPRPVPQPTARRHSISANPS